MTNRLNQGLCGQLRGILYTERSERISDGKRKIEIIAGVFPGTGNPSVVFLHRRIPEFDTQVKAKNEIVEVEPETHSCADCKLPVKASGPELCSRPVVLLIYRPDIAGIYKESALEVPDQPEPVLQVSFYFYVARLIGIRSWRRLVCTRTQRPNLPCPYSVGTAGKVLFLKGEYVKITIGHSDPEKETAHNGVEPVYHVSSPELNIGLNILGIPRIQEFVILLRPETSGIWFGYPFSARQMTGQV